MDRTNVVTVRLTDDEHETLKALADRDGLSFSDVLRRLLKLREAEVAKPRRRSAAKSRGGVEGVFHRHLAAETIVHDMATQNQLMRLDGVVALPLGAEIELVEPNVNARVMRVRLLCNEPATVCLDVHVPD